MACAARIPRSTRRPSGHAQRPAASPTRNSRWGRRPRCGTSRRWQAARFSLTNWNPSAGSHPSPERTRPRLLRGSAIQLELADLTPQTVELSRSAVVRPSARGPRHGRPARPSGAIACAGVRNTFASSSGPRPARTSSIICRRNSRIRAVLLCHCGLRKLKKSGVHEAGQLPSSSPHWSREKRVPLGLRLRSSRGSAFSALD